MRFLSVKQTAEILNVRPQRVYDLVAKGILPHVRLGTRQIRIPEEALRKWAENALRGGEIR